jgi:hypothetical protein
MPLSAVVVAGNVSTQLVLLPSIGFTAATLAPVKEMERKSGVEALLE